MKEIHINNQDKGMLVASYEATGVLVYRIADNMYDVYFDDIKIDGHVLFPDESGNGCANCIHVDSMGACIFRDRYGIGCTGIKYFGCKNNVSWRE